MPIEVIPKTIKKRSEFLSISKCGSRAKTESLVSVCLEKKGDESFSAVGYTASKKVGNSVKRNKAKRRFRSLVREFSLEFSRGYYFVLIATKKTVDIEYKILKSDFIYCVRRSKKRAQLENNG